jgi:hypothetical protein
MFKVLTLPFTLLRLFFKLTGVKGGILFGLGLLAGLLIAPQTGAELRAAIQARLAASEPIAPADADPGL